MKNEIKCYRCGKVKVLEARKLSEEIECSHCHSKMRLTYKCERRLKTMRYITVLVVALVISFGLTIVNRNNTYTLIIAILLVSLAMALVVDKFCLWMVYATKGLEYEEYHPEEIEKMRKEREKEKEKEKKRKKAEKEKRKNK